MGPETKQLITKMKQTLLTLMAAASLIMAGCSSDPAVNRETWQKIALAGAAGLAAGANQAPDYYSAQDDRQQIAKEAM